MFTFKDLFMLMKDMGMFDFFFPWVLFTAIIYGVLQSKQYISDQSSVNGAIALSLSFLIAYFGRGIFLANIFWIFGVFLVIFVLGILIATMVGVNIGDVFKDKSWVAYLGVGLGVLSLIGALIITDAYGYFGLDKLSVYGLSNIFSFLVVIAVIIGVIYLIAKT